MKFEEWLDKYFVYLWEIPVYSDKKWNIISNTELLQRYNKAYKQNIWLKNTMNSLDERE